MSRWKSRAKRGTDESERQSLPSGSGNGNGNGNGNGYGSDNGNDNGCANSNAADPLRGKEENGKEDSQADGLSAANPATPANPEGSLGRTGKNRGDSESLTAGTGDTADTADWADSPAQTATQGQEHQQALGVNKAAAQFWEEVVRLRALCPAAPADADAEQSEELEALVAIYGDALQLLSDGDSVRTLRLELSGQAAGSGETKLLVSTADGDIPAGVVGSLPPVAMLCALPRDYPLPGSPDPLVTLDAEHLAAGWLAQLQTRLRELAAGRGQGELVLFDLAAALQEAVAAPPQQLHLGDETQGALQVALQLLAHDRRARTEWRQQQVQVCPMCFDDVVGSRGIFLDCDHFGCRACLEQMSKLYIAEGDAQALRCPVPDCRRPFSSSAVRDVLGSDTKLVERWDELTLQRCLEQMQDVVFCPRCDADSSSGGRSPCVEDEDHMARCSRCDFIFCGRCRGVYHPGVACESSSSALELRAQGQGPEAAAARAELLTLRQLARTTKPCPLCKSTIEKTDGCSKVQCANCKGYFCWRCGKVIHGYDHFATSECRLFDDEEIQRWNKHGHVVDRTQARAHEARFVANFVDPAQLWQQARQCPRCRSVVVREGRNNHMRCHACQTQFCGRCGCLLARNKAGEHFGKMRVCPQHSDD